MASKNTAVFGIYPHQKSVESGVNALKAAGFSNNDISVLFPNREGTKDFAHEKSTKAQQVPEREFCWAEGWDGWLG
jgi:hypothetical protein